MLTIDENELRSLVAPLAKPKAKSYVFERLARPVRIDFLPLGQDNSEWLNFVINREMRRKPAAGEQSVETTALMPADVDVESVDFRKGCHEGVDFITKVRIVGWAVRGDDGVFVDRQYTPELGAQLLHALIDAPHGLIEYIEFTAALSDRGNVEPAPDPSEVSGNSSGG